MKKKSIILIIFFLIVAYIFSAMYSFHQVHKSIYYNNKQISKIYIEWIEVRKNFKDFFNANLLNQMSNNKELEGLGGLEILVTGFASKFVDMFIDTYINPEGLSLLIEKTDKKSEIPEPNFLTLVGGISIMKFNSLNTFYVNKSLKFIIFIKAPIFFNLYVNLETNDEIIPIFFKRFGTKWKVVEIEFPEDIFNEIQ